ncbi:MAG: hypothetical protein ACT4TC_15540 [Myxococcaceae bacterium]
MDPGDLQAFQDVYADIAGYKLSHHDRNERKTEDRSFVYGEVVPDSFEALVALATPTAEDRFVDLGCGIGKAVLLAALSFPFKECAGVELLPSLLGAARGAHGKLSPRLRSSVSVKLVEGDLLDWNLRENDVVFIHSSCFERALMERLTAKLTTELHTGARLVTVGRTFHHPSLQRVHAGKCEMDWGAADAWIYRKT